MFKSKKGFSLVELIVVIAIMAVLVGVLAPTLIGYVEKSRAQRDASNLEELRHNVELAIADETVYQELAFDDTTNVATLTFTNAGKVLDVTSGCGDADSELYKALVGKVGAKIDLTSKKYGKNQNYVVTITYYPDTENVKVTDNASDF